VLAVRYLWHGQEWGGLFSTEPFYNPKTFNSLKILTATSFAALTYIGFDGVTTLQKMWKIPSATFCWRGADLHFCWGEQCT
jgi:putrescine importer